MSKLTAKTVDNAKPKDKEYLLPDGRGLCLRVRPSGAKSWIFRYRRPSDEGQDKMTLGLLKDMSLKQARDELSALRKLLEKGIDPKQDKAAKVAENIQAVTMSFLFNAWIEHLQVGGSVTDTWVQRHRDRWRLHLKKYLENILARDITRAHLAAALDAMTRKGIKEETRKALTTLNLMFDYGVSRHLVEQNPARLLRPKDFAATASRPRDRALNLTELRKLWLALELASEEKDTLATTATLQVATVIAIKILILTGARRG